VFVCPSTQDNLPNTVLEAMACGTPVIANDIGGMPDLLCDDAIGFLVGPKKGNKKIVEAIRNCISKCSINKTKTEHAQFNLILSQQAENYINIYQSYLRYDVK
jgi:glycosyltransferase involved in cell wall biosynthesis